MEQNTSNKGNLPFTNKSADNPADKSTKSQNRKEESKKDPFLQKMEYAHILICSLVLIVFFIVGCAFFARPKVSEIEKRELNKFPSFNMNDFLSGKYTSDISLWYSDTYPTREGMISASDAIKSLYGIKGSQFSSGNSSGDDIPDTPMNPNKPSDTDSPNPPDDENHEKGEQIGAFYVRGDTAFELYHFNQLNSQRYASLINSAADSLSGKAHVYDLIVPLSYTFAFNSDELSSTGASDCEKAISYIYSGLSQNVSAVNICQNMHSHKNEYLYYRTDHHWTARGAYYAYESFCSAKGISPTPLSSYERLEFGGFLGTLYADTKANALKNNPDTVEAFVPMGTNIASVTERNGNITKYSIVNKQTDKFYANAASKYNCFIAGDNPLTEIHNPDKTDNSSIVVIKESFGNAFVPFLVDSYEYVYVIDYRYFSGNLYDFVTSHNVGDVLFINNVIATSTSARLNEMEKIIKK